MSTSDLAQGIIQTNASTNLVSQWVQQYLIDCQARQLVHGTISFYRKKLNQFVRYCNEFGVTTIDQINANLIRGFLVNLEERATIRMASMDTIGLSSPGCFGTSLKRSPTTGRTLSRRYSHRRWSKT